MTHYSPHHEHQTRTGQDTTAPEAQTYEPSSPILLPTPNANLATKGGSQHPDKRRGGGTRWHSMT